VKVRLVCQLVVKMAFMGKKDQNVAKVLAKGTLTGFVEAMICYPTEFIKTQLQLQSKSNPQYKGIMDCGMKTIRSHGFTALYRGAAPLILGSSIKQAARWTAYAQVSGQFRNKDGSINLAANMFSGFCAGFSEAVCAVTPMETIKTRAVDDVKMGTKKYTGSFDATVKIVKAEGLGGIYRGVVPTIMKQGTNQMIRFPIQQFYFGLMFGKDESRRQNPWLNGLCGAMAGGTSVLLTMPQDTVKTRMQGEEAKKLYKGTIDCIQQIIKKEGVMFFWTGTWPRFLRVTMDVGITFTIYPFLNNLF